MSIHKKLHEFMRFIGASPRTLEKGEWDELYHLLEKEHYKPHQREEYEKLRKIITDALKANNRHAVLEMMPRLKELADNEDE